MKGTIYLVPVSLGGDEIRDVIPELAINITRQLRYFAVEDLRSARRYLRKLDKQFPVDDTLFLELSEHTGDKDISQIIEPALKGHDMGLMSEAGLPGIADPGSSLIALAHRNNIRVVPLAGPSSIIMALVASGMNGQNFSFNGYLPVKPAERDTRIRELEKKAHGAYAQIFMETPYRNQKLFGAILSVCKEETLLCIASDLTLPTEWVRTKSISQWKKEIPDLKDHLVVYVLQ